MPVFSAHAAGRDRNIWAPEFHLLNGPNGRRWYIYYSAGDGDIESQRVHVLESAGLDPMGPYTYRGMVFGSNDWWGIDGSVVTIDDQLYFTWSGVPTKLWRDSVPHIYIVAMSNPWTVTGSRTAISEPTYDWEKQGTPDERRAGSDPARRPHVHHLLGQRLPGPRLQDRAVDLHRR